MIYLNDVGDGLGRPKRGLKKHFNRRRNPAPIIPVENVESIPANNDEIGLGKAKFLKKIKLKPMIKQIGKVAKVAAPIAAGFIPVGGGMASGLVSKVTKSGVGRTALKLGKSKVGSAVLSQAGIEFPQSEESAAPAMAMPVKRKKGFLNKKPVATKSKSVAKSKFPIKFKKKKTSKTLALGSSGEEVKELQQQLGVEPDGSFGPKTQQALQQATGQKTINTDAIQSQEQSMDEEQPQGELTPVSRFQGSGDSVPPANSPAPKDNTLLYVGGGALLLGGIFLATRNK